MSITAQKALLIISKGAPFTIGQHEIPVPRAGEILVRIQATALNPVDWKIQQSGVYVDTYPAILGTDSAGFVEAVGEGVTNFAVGDRVLHQGFFINRNATFQQYTVVPAEIAAKIPPEITFDQAATIPLGLATAAVGFYNKKWERGGAQLTPPWQDGGRGKYADQPILIFAGSSSVGQYAIQLARLSGFSPIITTVSPHNNELVRSLGATHPLDRNLPVSTVTDSIKNITSKPFIVIYDAFGGSAELQNLAYDLLAPGGKLVTVLSSKVDADKITPDKEVISTFGTVHAENNRELGKSLYGNLTELLASGDLVPNNPEYHPGGLASIPAQLERMKKNQVSGAKLVVRPPETL